MRLTELKHTSHRECSTCVAIREASDKELMDRIKGLDAQQMEDLLGNMALYFEDAADELTNLDARAVAGNLRAAARIISYRSGN